MPPSAGSSTVLFDAVRGHSRQKDRLRAAIELGRVPHAMIFVGPGGVGKHLTAVAVAQGLFCSSPSGRPCGTCSGCYKTAASLHPDLIVIGVDEETKSRTIVKEQIDELALTLSRTPGESGRRVVIIDPAERMTEVVQSAFLKTLEEPMGATFFILITSDANTLMPTILSRCQLIRFGALGLGDTEDILLKAAEDMSPREASEYARLSQGSVEEALFLRDGGYREIAENAFRTALLTLERHPVEWPETGSQRDELLLLIDALMRVYRDALLLSTANDTAHLFFPDRAEDLRRLCAARDADQLQGALDSIVTARGLLLSYVNPRLVITQLLLDLGLKLF